MIRIAVIADIHHGAPSATKRGDAALPLMAEFARFVADARPDLVLDLGDRISDIDRETDLRLEREVADAFRAIDTPVCHLNGNHDRDHLTVAENAEILGQPMEHQILDLDGWRLALWRADSRIARGPDHCGFVLSEADLLWLSRTAQTADRPMLVASHVPVSEHSQVGNYYFQRNPAASTYPMADRARAALAQSRHPVVCLAGHVHWNTVTQIDGIAHLTQQSLTESFTTQGEPAAAWGLMELGQALRWEVFGRDPFAVTLTPSARRWTPPLPPFGEHRGLVPERKVPA